MHKFYSRGVLSPLADVIFVAMLSGYGFHEDGLKVVLFQLEGEMKSRRPYNMDNNLFFAASQAGAIAAQGLLKRNFSVLKNPKHMVPTWPETGARLLVNRFLKSFITTGCIM